MTIKVSAPAKVLIDSEIIPWLSKIAIETIFRYSPEICVKARLYLYDKVELRAIVDYPSQIDRTKLVQLPGQSVHDSVINLMEDSLITELQELNPDVSFTK